MEQEYCDQHLWMRGLDGACRAFIEAMPAEKRATWRRVLFTNSTELSPPRDGVVYLIGIRERHWVSLPMSEEMLVETEMAPAILERLDYSWQGIAGRDA